MLKGFRVLLLMMLVCLLVISGGCADEEPSGDIVVGVAWPFASNNSLFDEGIELALREINQNGGIDGRPLRLLKDDDEASVIKGMAIAQSFAQNEDVVAVIGHRNSSVSIPASRIYENAGVVMLSPASTAPNLTQQGYEHIFRNIPSDSEITRQLARYAAEEVHQRMVIYYSDDAYGIGLANAFEDHARDAGITIVDRVSYYGDLAGLERLHQKWQAFGFDGVFIADGMPGGANFMRDALRAGITVPYFGGNAMDSPQLYQILGKAAEGTVVGTIFDRHSTREEVQLFMEIFFRVYNQVPGPYAAQGYDAVMLLAAALEQADTVNRDAVAESLRQIGKQPGVAGYHQFDENGDDIGDLVVIKVLRNGRFIVPEPPGSQEVR